MPLTPETHPLLEGEAAAQARAVVDAIAAEIAAPLPDPSVARGSAGLAIFWHFRSKVAAEEGRHEEAARAVDLAEVAIEAALDGVATLPLGPGLFPGFTGVAWALEILHGEDEGDDPGEPIDASLLDWLERTPWSHPYDLVSGLAGIGVYALQRRRRRAPGPQRVAEACLSRVVDRLEELAQERPEGIAWHTPPALIVPQQHAPEGYDNLGLAHGVPGVVAVLASMIGAGVETRRAGTLLEGAVRWVLAHDRPEGFLPWVGPGTTASGSRVGWCTGDPGVAAAIALAGRTAGVPAWDRAALAVARRAAATPFSQSGIHDAGLCHGGAGAAHVLGRIARMYGDEPLAEAARTLWTRTLAMRRPGEGVAGFPALVFRDGEHRWKADPGLIAGAAGVGLALLSATSTIAPAWDRLLLVS